MKVAMTVWNGRISPVCDAARRLVLIETDDSAPTAEPCRQEEPLPADQPLSVPARLAELRVEILICGAISRPLAELVLSAGIRLISFIAGGEEEVLKAFIEERLGDPEFQMPGCCGRHGRRRAGNGRGGMNAGGNRCRRKGG